MKGLVGFLAIVFLISLIAGVAFRCDSDEANQQDTSIVENVDSTIICKKLLFLY
jgi:hypothetical protein